MIDKGMARAEAQFMSKQLGIPSGPLQKDDLKFFKHFFNMGCIYRI